MSDDITMALSVMAADLSIVNHDGWELPNQTPMPDLRQHPLLVNGVSKWEWAERHLRALHHNIESYFAEPANKSVLRADLDAESGDHIFRVASIPDTAVIAEHFQLSLADVAGNLRHALDQFAWRLACEFAGGEPKDPKGVHFPIRDERDDFANHEGRARRQFDPRHWEFFERFQPYHGVADRPDRWTGPYAHQLTLLSDLTNSDKHRATEPVLLIPTQFGFRVQIDGPPMEIDGHAFRRSEIRTSRVGEIAELGTEVLRARLVEPAEPHIDNAGEMTPHVALAEGRGAVGTLARIAYYVHLMFSEFARDFPPEP